MQNTLLKVWGIEPLHMAKQLTMSQSEDFQTLETNLGTRKPIIKLPLHFTYLPVEIISKQLTKLNSKYKERIIYLGPRWQQSFQWHKKFSKPVQPKTQTTEENITSGYYFNQRRVVRNNSFIHDSMRQNRFFKNQIYYRAFEGMNPTINDSEEIVFESKFQSGNLDCVVKIDQNQYDLFLRIDTNTRGNLFWYYFTIKLPTESKMKSKVVRLNICNITKSRTLYEKNLRPYVKRRKNNDTSNDRLIDNWIQGDGIKNCKIKQKKLRYKFIYQKIKTSLLHELSFQIQLKYDQQVSLAYCIPYTYSFLMSQLSQLQKQLQSRNIKKVFINKLGQSLTGVQIPMITIGDVRDVQSNNDDKKVVFITGRAHPGESNSSLILSSLINQLCLKKLDQILESRVVFVIIPMLNPDGVIFGNGRSTALGRDINRQFKVWNSFLNPQVVAVKKLIDKIQQYYEIQMYFDFHGHSKKKNIFFFGPAYSVADPNYYRCRVFPKILSRNLDFFRYYGCSYVIPESKMTTARSVMLNEFNIPFFYTVETSVGFYHDYAKRQDVPFDKASLFKIGLKFKQSIKQYFQGVEQYELYLKNKKKQKNLKTQLALKQLTQKDPSNQDQKISNLKFIKVFEEIKTETKNLEKAKKQQISDSDSDSCRVQEQMQVEKVKEFSQMVITFNKIQIQKIRKTEIIPVDEENQHLSKRKQNKKKASKHHSQLNDDIASLLRRFTTKNQPQFRIHSNSMKIDFPRTSRLKQSVQLANQFSQDQKNLILPEHPKKSIRIISPDKKLKQLNISAHNFFRRNDLDLQSQEGQRIGVLNFSSMVQNPKSLRYSQDHTKFRASSRGQKRKIITNIEEEKSRINSNLTKFFFPFSEEKDQFLADQFGQGGIRNSNNPKPYPASFYRIKYQSSHKKYRDKSPEPVVSSFRRFQQERISFSPKKQQKNTKNAVFREPQKLFINISKIAN